MKLLLSSESSFNLQLGMFVMIFVIKKNLKIEHCVIIITFALQTHRVLSRSPCLWGLGILSLRKTSHWRQFNQVFKYYGMAHVLWDSLIKIILIVLLCHLFPKISASKLLMPLLLYNKSSKLKTVPNNPVWRYDKFGHDSRLWNRQFCRNCMLKNIRLFYLCSFLYKLFCLIT